MDGMLTISRTVFERLIIPQSIRARIHPGCHVRPEVGPAVRGLQLLRPVEPRRPPRTERLLRAGDAGQPRGGDLDEEAGPVGSDAAETEDASGTHAIGRI